MLEQEGFVYKESGLGTKVLSNLTLLDDEPLVIEHTYMPVSQVPACPKGSWKGRSILTCTRSCISSLAGSSAGSRLICQINMTGSTLGSTKARRFWKSSRSSGPIPGSTLNILGQETSTATGLISWSKPAIKLTKKYPLKESKSSVGISLLSYLLAL